MMTDIAPVVRGGYLARYQVPVILAIAPAGEPAITAPTPEELPAALATAQLPLPGELTVEVGGQRCGFTVRTLGELSAQPHPGELAALAAAPRGQVVAGKVAVVTGGAQGFGAEIVRGLVASGAFVYIADLNFAGASQLASELGPAAHAVEVNVADETSVAALAQHIAGTTGGLDLVISNAGIVRAGGVLAQDVADFQLTTQVNYTAFFLVVKHLGRMLEAQHRAAPGWLTDIIQINSKSGLVGSNRNGAYAGSKFGGLGLVQSFALELIEYGVKVNAICPGNFYDGPLWSDPDRGLFVQYLRSGKVPGATTVQQVREFYEAKVPMRRGTFGADVMRAIYYLVEQAYETGQAVPVTGGQVMLS